MQKNIFFICSILLLSLFFCACGQKSTEELLTKAFSSAQNSKWKSALQYAKKAHEQSPLDLTPLLLLVITEEHNEQMDEALSNAAKAAEMYPESFLAQYFLGNIHYNMGRYEQAIPFLTRALAMKSHDANTLALLGQAKLITDTDGADACYIRLANTKGINDKSIIYNQLAIIFTLKHQPEKALKIIQVATQNSMNPILYLNKGIINDYFMGNIPEARSAYNQFLELAQGRNELEEDYRDIQKRLNEIRNW